ncbi:MAG: ATP-binding cassette domain-containing protein [Rickettsiaceae bacterium]|nr:ATP-binding cassette domain-containing protein [Rickettsiaceae bacterium]
MTNNDVKIQIKSLMKSFGNHQVLQGIDLDIKKDRSLVILGGSGSGKSVLIKIIIGLIKPDSGSVLLDGQDIINISHKERLRILENCGFLFQNGALFDSLNVEDNITFFAEKLYSLKKKEKRELASSKLKSVGLSDRILKLYPAELSGGMQKRVSLARSICTNPKIIFFDEPTTGLDPIMANVINDLIIKVREELGATTITITHDINSAKMIGQDVAFLHSGKILWHGCLTEMEKTDNPFLHQFINGLTKGPVTV